MLRRLVFCCFLSGLCDREHFLAGVVGVLRFLSGLCDRELAILCQCHGCFISERSMRP